MTAVQITAVLDEHFVKQFRSISAAAEWLGVTTQTLHRAFESRSGMVGGRTGYPFYVKRIPAAEYREEIPEEWRY